ncbi:MAG: purine-binding chemotaxis protein CheW [Clostridiales bacterium]|nr:purine-binding chemotaxis protein CheW [Clostridiales bacterium]
MSTQENDYLKNKYLEVLLEKTVYGIDVTSVVEILRYREINHVHGQPDYIEGSIVFREKAVPVFNLRKRFELEAKEADENTCIIALNVKGKSVGFIVDNVANIVEIQPEEITEIEEFNVSISNQFILGIATKNRQVVLLDSQKILSNRELKNIEL